MQDVITERAEQMIVKLWEQDSKGDPDNLYHEAAEVIADLAEAWTAAQEVIAALRLRLDRP